MTNITNAELTQMKERAEKATGGPWEHDVWSNAITNDGGSVDIISNVDGQISVYDNDAEFIAHAREDVPRLVAEVERLREHIQSALFYVENDGNFRDIYDELKEALGE